MPKFNTACAVCGKEFYAQPQRLKNKNICCSKTCAAALKKRNANKNAICPVCNKQFHAKPYHLKKYKNVCCSMPCHKAWRSLAMTGSGNHQYGLKGHKNASFKGSVIPRANNKLTDMMIYSPEHPFSDARGRIKYHRFIVEKNYELFNSEYFIKIGNDFYLKPEFIVHHIDGDHNNNDVNNLRVMTKGEHSRLHCILSKRNRNPLTGRFLPKEIVKFKSLSDKAKIPVRATNGAAGWDMFAASVEDKEDMVIYKTDIAIEIPVGYAGLLLARSSVIKTGLFLGPGVGLIDRDYRGNISFVFYKRDSHELYKEGDRIGQLVITPIPEVEFEEVSELSETERGSGGFGSTGK